MKNISVFLAFLLLLSQSVSGQDFSNKGKDFWIPYTGHIDATVSRMALYISSDVNTTGEVQLAGTVIPFTVTANQATTIQISPTTYSVYNAQSDGINTGKGIHVISVAPVVVYAHILNQARSGSTLVLPTNVLGRDYIALAYTQASNAPSNTAKSQITVVGVENNTVVEINPVAASVNNTRPAKVAFQVTLNKGDVYQYQSFTDLTGSSIKSVSSAGSGCKPIAVFTGSTWTSFDCVGASGGDNLYQQLFPVNSWGKNFLTAPFVNRIYDIFRVMVSDETTQVTLNGNVVNPATLINKQYYEFKSSVANVIMGDKPIQVVHYMTSQSCDTRVPTNPGDPEIVTLNPIEQTIKNVTVVSARNNLTPPNTNITVHYLNITMLTAYTGSLKIDNAAPTGTWTQIGTSAYSYLQENVTSSTNTNPSHNIQADAGFSAVAYGMGNVESYGYNAGTNVKDFTPVTTFQNLFRRIDSAVTCINTPLQFSVPLTFIPATVKWDFSAAPNISPAATIGPSASNTPDSTKTINGQTFTYYSPGKTFVFTNTNNASLRDTIKLYTTSATPDGCGSTDQVYAIPVKVNSLPFVKFTASTSGCATDSVLITDQSGPELNKWKWDFGDGSSEDRTSGAIFSKKYNAGGNFTIKLKGISDIGCISDEISSVVTITDKPIAKFTFQAVTCAESDISFTDASTTTTGIIAKWTWNLDDGAAAITNTTNASVKTKYTVYGTKNPTLAVETATGCKSDVFTATNFKVNPLPEVNFGIPEVCLSDANASFTDSTKIAEGSIASYLWNFNAGTPAVTPGPDITSSTAKNPQVKYNKSDNYLVSLKVTSAASCVGITTLGFTVNGSIPKSVFEMANPAPYCGTRAVQLKNLSTVDFGNVTKLEIYWDFVNAPTIKETIDIPVNGKIYPHSYPDPTGPKQYTIRMVAYSGGTACSDFSSTTLTVYPLPRAAFTVSASQLCFGDVVTFTDKSNGISSAAATWQWDLGKSVPSNLQNPVHQYNDSGLIDVSLYFTNADGCVSDTAVKTLTIYPNPKLILKHNELVLSGGLLTIIPQNVYGNQLQYLWTPATYLSSDTSVAPKCIPDDDITYKLTLTAQGGCTASDTVFVKVLKGPEVPNVFSPNGDGINDTWRIKYLESYVGASVEVYNRGGQIVYRSIGYTTDWDGTYKGSPLPVGTYYYIINPRNSRPIVTGSVTIIK